MGLSLVRSAQWHLIAAVAFAAMAVLGLGFACLGPVSLVRTLGVVAAVAGAGGVALHVHFVREFYPSAWRSLEQGVAAWRERRNAAYARAATPLAT